MTSLTTVSDGPEATPTVDEAARARSAPMTFGALLKSWRAARRYSQLALALEANVSQRHLSFLESGRAQPSREMVLTLSEVLGVPLRERNDLLLATGFAPLYGARPLDSADMVAVKHALDLTLRHHEPYPALAVDRQWNVVLHNSAVDRLLELVGVPSRVWLAVDPSGRRNLMRLTLHPLGMQPLVRNWDEVATALLARLQREVTVHPTDLALRGLLSELCALPGLPLRWRHARGEVTPPPVLALELGPPGQPALRLFSMVSTFGTAMDVTADELRLELLFPQDEFTADFLGGRSGTPSPVSPRPSPSARPLADRSSP